MNRYYFTGRFIFVFVIIFLFRDLSGQLADDFSDADIYSNPEWQGNTENFIVNNKYQLQLDAPDGGSSNLYTQFVSPDSIEWGIYFKMDFSPSVSNKIRIYLMTDSYEFNKANAYFIEIGENGSLDNLKFYRVKNGLEQLIGSGTQGRFSDTPAEAYLKITKDKNGIWNFYIKKNKDFFVQDFEVFDDQLNFQNCYFLINCQYTSTRKDKFFFDDVYIKAFKPDREAPKITNCTLLDTKTLMVTFDEAIDESSIHNTTSYSIKGTELLPAEILFDSLVSNQITLKYNNEFTGGKFYTIYVTGVFDLSGNICSNEKSVFFLLENPSPQDIVINELLFNPYPNGSDFVEILNKSDKFINLKGLWISNSSSNKSIVFSEDQIMRKGDYVCVTNNAVDIVNHYYVPDSILFYELSLPSFSDDMGNVSLYYLDNTNVRILVDSFDYNKSMHSGFISNDEGISLERKNPMAETNDRFNWNSCSTLFGGATPGYINSNYRENEPNNKGIKIINGVFSPDQDGYNDELEIEYSYEYSGNLFTADIYDSKGRFIHRLINNETLGNTGLITWNGLAGDFKVPIGIYILNFTVTSENGIIEKGREAFALAGKLK
jgi:hypothetical protein